MICGAGEQRTTRSRVAFAREALRLPPLCADAHVISAAETAQSAEERRDLSARGVEAGELALGPEGFEKYAGSLAVAGRAQGGTAAIDRSQAGHHTGRDSHSAGNEFR